MDNDPDKQGCEEGPKGYTETAWYASIICIENLDNQIKCYLEEEAVTQIFTKDSFEQLNA